MENDEGLLSGRTVWERRLLVVVIAGGSGLIGFPVLVVLGFAAAFAGFGRDTSFGTRILLGVCAWWLAGWILSAMVRRSSRLPFNSALLAAAIVGLQAAGSLVPFAFSITGTLAPMMMVAGGLASVLVAHRVVEGAAANREREDPRGARSGARRG